MLIFSRVFSPSPKGCFPAAPVPLVQARSQGEAKRSPVLCGLILAGFVSEQGGVGADRVRKDLIQLAGDTQLVLLQLRQTADHQRVFEVRCDHRFKQVHIVSAELT